MMMGIKLYELTYDWGHWAVVIAVDDAMVTDALLHEINGSGDDAEERIQDAGGLLFAVLRLLYLHVQARSHAGWFTLDQLKTEVTDGYPTLDGSFGFELISIDEMYLDFSLVDIEEKDNGDE